MVPGTVRDVRGNSEHSDYDYDSLKDEQKTYIKKQVDDHYKANFKYGNDDAPTIAIFQQKWIGGDYHCINLICKDVIPYKDLLK